MTGLVDATLASAAWPAQRYADAIHALAQHAGLEPRIAMPPRHDLDAPSTAMVERTAAWLGIEAEPVDCKYPEVDAFLASVAPALVPLAADGVVLAMVSTRRGRASLLGPDLRVHRVPLEVVRARLCHALEAPHLGAVEQIMRTAKLGPSRRERASRALLATLMTHSRVDTAWTLRRSPATRFPTQLRAARLPREVATLVAAHVAQYAIGLLGWAMLGRAALEGHVDVGWLFAWALCLLTQAGFRTVAVGKQGEIAIAIGTLLKPFLLYGALRLDAEETRAEGVGSLLGRVQESEALETLGLSSAFTAALALLELAGACVVLAVSAGGAIAAIALVGWTVLTAAASWRYLARRDAWAQQRIAMTHDLVERIAGHRTRLAQARPTEWHHGEDEAVTRYLELSEGADRALAWIATAAPRGWLVLGIACFVPALVDGSASTIGVAVAIGGVLLAHGALERLLGGLANLTEAIIAWKQAAPIARAACVTEVIEPPALPGAPTALGATVLEARDVVFRYRAEGRPVLRGCDLSIRAGDRLVLEGGSGGGKSTFGSVIAGLRAPESGILMLEGLDRSTIGHDGWRRRVAAAPQFHENHVLSGTLSFNLLVGRAWPPTTEDLDEAEKVCRELGLGGLLDRMPAGLDQMVGETGWQLSHGERSRVFIARALLQRADLVLLDESLAALDSETAQRVVACLERRAKSLLVIAHP